MDSNEVKQDIQKLISIFQKTMAENLYDEREEKIQVSHIMSHISSVYEKVRNAIDYSEEHLIRKNAIQRILKRKIRVSINRKNIGKTLITELIRAKYLENNFVPVSKIDEVENVITKYLLLLDMIGKAKGVSAKLQHFDWIIGIASCEIEERLNLLMRNDAMVNSMYQLLNKKVEFLNSSIDESERNLLFYIAVHRTLVKSDESILSFHLLNLYYPTFRRADEKLISSIAKDIDLVHDNIAHYLRHPLAFKLSKFLQKHAVYFTVLRDVIEEDEKTAYVRILNKDAFEDDIRSAANKRYKATDNKLHRSIFNSVVYIFATKIVLAFALELPYEYFILNELRVLPLAINIIFPPVFMFALASSAKLPTAQNTLAIIEGIKSIIYKDAPDQEKYGFKASSKRSVAKTVAFTLVYALIFFVSFGGVIYFLTFLEFNIVSILFFLLFFSVVSFLGIKIRSSVKTLTVLKVKEGFLSSLIDFLFLPVLKVGQWISMKFSKINVFAIFLDFIIEAPFKTVIEMIEEWFSFMKEKKEEIL
ncbi:MAG TPA: hypothetical protein VJA22_00750 [Patescibacteria group bacterium]|nr:hypothetical protein [Patescibacteria group bacterium]